MFDLFRSRDKMVRYLLGGLLLIVALSMVTYLIPSYNDTGVGDSSVLAEVGGTRITALYAQQKFSQLTKGNDIPAEMMDVYLPQFVDNMILQRAAVYQAERQGLTANDDEVLAGMMLNYQQFFPNGVLASKEALEQFFAQQGQSVQDALDDMRSQLTLRKLQNALLETTVVNPDVVKGEYTKKYEKAKVQYIAFPPAKFRDEVKVADSDVQAYFNAHRNEYPVPEKYTYDAVVVDQAKVEATIDVPEAQLRQAYSASMDNFRMPERVKARHILVKTEGKSDAEKKPLLAKAEDLLKQLKGGADFAKLAEKSSEDTGSGQQGGDLGWLVRGQTVPEFEKVAFAQKVNDLSSIVTTQFGYHIIQVTEKESARVRPFEEVKADLTKELRQRNVVEKMQGLSEQVRAALNKNPKGAAEIAKQFGVETVHMNNTAAGQAIPSLGVSPEIDQILPSLPAGGVSGVLILPGDRLVVVAMASKTPGRTSEFEEVKAQVRDRVINDAAGKLAEAKAKEAADRLKKGEDITQVAKSMKLDVTTSSDFNISDSVEGLGPAIYVEGAFTQPVGTVLGPSSIQGRQIVSKVLAKTPADMAAFEAERETILRDLKVKRAQERNDLMLDSILQKLKDSGKVKVYPEQIQKLVASYRKTR